MKNYVVIRNTNGTETKHEAVPGLNLPVQSGDEVELLDENGNPITVGMRPADQDLILKFADQTDVVLANFYPQDSEESEGEPVTIALPLSDDDDSNYEFNSQMGNLPGTEPVTLMRYSNVPKSALPERWPAKRSQRTPRLSYDAGQGSLFRL